MRTAYTTDHLGSIREVFLLDGITGNPTTATLTARYDYDLWGKRTVLDGGTAAETLTLHGYAGHVYHQQSGLWLAPFRAYSPALGRWNSRDPIGVSGGINLFEYVGNGPGVAVDPLGWEPTLNLFNPTNDRIVSARANESIPSQPGIVSVVGHGWTPPTIGTDEPVMVGVGGPKTQRITAKALASVLQPFLDADPGAEVTLYVCHGGSNWLVGISFAQALADETGRRVNAVDSFVDFLDPTAADAVEIPRINYPVSGSVKSLSPPDWKHFDPRGPGPWADGYRFPAKKPDAQECS